MRDNHDSKNFIFSFCVTRSKLSEEISLIINMIRMTIKAYRKHCRSTSKLFYEARNITPGKKKILIVKLDTIVAIKLLVSRMGIGMVSLYTLALEI